MKGIAHFFTGVAIATCFPEVVRQAGAGSLLPVLGGIAGILPDTIDFKFVRYFETYDDEIDPGPEPDAGEIARRVVSAMRRAYESGRPQRVMLHTIRLGADLWQQYAIRFDPEQNEVAVRVGPVVDTSQTPLPDGTGHQATSLGKGDSHPSQVPPLPSPPAGGTEGGRTEGRAERREGERAGERAEARAAGKEAAREARVKVNLPMVHTYDEEIKIDIFSGPSFTFERQGDQLHVHFLDWHRRWSHSLTLAAALGLAGGLILGKWAGLVIGLGFAGHVLEDQLGFMGSNLFYPFTRRRSPGAQLLRSGDALPNFLTVWTATALILFNLDRFSAQPRLNPWGFLGLAVALPVVLLGGVYQWQRCHRKHEARESLQQRDIVAETEEVEVG